jgi:hypothetical protein
MKYEKFETNLVRLLKLLTVLEVGDVLVQSLKKFTHQEKLLNNFSYKWTEITEGNG